MSGNRIKVKKNSCVFLEQILIKTSGSSTTLKDGKLKSNIYCTWQRTNDFIKSQEKKILPLIAPFCLLLFRQEGCGSDLATQICHGYVGSVSASVSGTHMNQCSVAQTSCCTAGNKRIWVESSLFLSLLFKGSFLKTAEEGWMLASTQQPQLAAHKDLSAHLGMLQCQNDHTTCKPYLWWWECHHPNSCLLYGYMSLSPISAHQKRATIYRIFKPRI